jgi:hypothetical protein
VFVDVSRAWLDLLGTGLRFCCGALAGHVWILFWAGFLFVVLTGRGWSFFLVLTEVLLGRAGGARLDLLSVTGLGFCLWVLVGCGWILFR